MPGKTMKFVALHGAIGNPFNFRVQLDPFCRELEHDGTCSFEFMQGQVPVKEPPGFEGYFGPGPHWRHIDDDELAENAMLEQIRTFPEADTPEDALRALIPPGLDRSKPAANLRKKLEWFFDQLDKIGDVDGIVGYSEGALVAATLLLEDERRVQQEGQQRRLKMGIFFAGWPALSPWSGGICLADECDDMIRVPTVHVIGSGDPYLDGSKALYNVCDEDTAVFFDHGKGHTLPRDPKTVGELGIAIRNSIEQAWTFK